MEVYVVIQLKIVNQVVYLFHIHLLQFQDVQIVLRVIMMKMLQMMMIHVNIHQDVIMSADQLQRMMNAVYVMVQVFQMVHVIVMVM